MVKKNAFVFALILLGIIFISGCLVTRTQAECDGLKNGVSAGETLKAGEASMCYHELAISYAIKNESMNAIGACGEAGDTTNIPIASSIAKANMNSCFAEIAELLHNSTICEEKIEMTVADPDMPFGAVFTSFRDECKRKAEASNYKIQVCGSATAFLIPIILVFLARRKIS